MSLWYLVCGSGGLFALAAVVFALARKYRVQNVVINEDHL